MCVLNSMPFPNIFNSQTYTCSINLNFSDVIIDGFCSQNCGWHYHIGNIKYAWVGVPPAHCSCIHQTRTPNGDAALDSAISSIGHELVETVTDPTFHGYCYSYGQPYCEPGCVEIGDQCVWYFPNSYLLANGAQSNIVVGGKNYLLQANWNLSTKKCSMS